MRKYLSKPRNQGAHLPARAAALALALLHQQTRTQSPMGSTQGLPDGEHSDYVCVPNFVLASRHPTASKDKNDAFAFPSDGSES